MNPARRPTARDFLYELIRLALSFGCGIEARPIHHEAGTWSQLRIVDNYPGLDKGIFLLTAGIHGTEITGPLTIIQRFAGIIASTRAAGLRLVCYPLMNPSGWDNGTERNIDSGGGEVWNNDYLRYQMFNGVWTSSPPGGHSYKRWLWSSDPIVGERQPAETRVMHGFLRNEDWPNIRVALDLHQDNLTQGTPAGAYYYSFGDSSQYSNIIAQIRRLTTVLGDYDFRFDRDKPDNVVRSDQNGCIVFHDGTLSDLAHQIGVPHALTIEATGATELQTAIEINMTWIRGLCGLVSS